MSCAAWTAVWGAGGGAAWVGRLLAEADRAQPVEGSLQDRREVVGVAVDGGDRDDHVEDLLQGEVGTDLVRVLGSGEERFADGEHALAIGAEERAVVGRLLEQLGADVTLAGVEREEPVEPGHEQGSRGVRRKVLRRLANRFDLVDVEGLEELALAREVAVEGRHADAGPARDLGHRDLGPGVSESGPGSREDLVAVALGVGTSRWRWQVVRGHVTLPCWQERTGCPFQ